MLECVLLHGTVCFRRKLYVGGIEGERGTCPGSGRFKGLESGRDNKNFWNFKKDKSAHMRKSGVIAGNCALYKGSEGARNVFLVVENRFGARRLIF